MIVTAILVAALVLALVGVARARGEDIIGWAVVLIAGALLMGRL